MIFFPRQKLIDNSYYNWPFSSKLVNKIVIKRFFTTNQAKIIYSQLLRYLSIKKILEVNEIRGSFLRILGDEALKCIVLDHAYIQRIIKFPQIKYLDDYRIIAVEAYYLRLLSHNDMNIIFKKTHLKPTNELPSKASIFQAAKILEKIKI